MVFVVVLEGLRQRLRAAWCCLVHGRCVFRAPQLSQDWTPVGDSLWTQSSGREMH